MRARLLPIGGNGIADALRFDTFPASISLDGSGRVAIDRQCDSEQLCLFDECDGNLIIKDRAGNDSLMVNDRPMSFGGLMPGDTLQLGPHRYLVSYERVTNVPPPSASFRLAAR